MGDWRWVEEGSGEEHLPLLDFVEPRQERNGNEDDDCFLAVADIDLKGEDVLALELPDVTGRLEISFFPPKEGRCQ